MGRILFYGCILLLVWGCKVTRMTPLDFASSIARTEMWLSWLSSSRITGRSLEGLTYLIKCSMNATNKLSFDHPDGFAAPMLPSGAPCSIKSLKLTLGNISIGGKNPPPALQAAIIVTVVPLSPLVIEPIYLTPVGAKIFGGTWTVDRPVSSIFQISTACMPESH